MISRCKQDLDQIERDLRLVRIEFEKFFNGALDVPPEDQLVDIAHRIKEVWPKAAGVADSFRLRTLEGQFNSYRELFQRRIRHLEVGVPRPSSRAQRATPAESYDPARGIVVGGEVPEAAAEILHRQLYSGDGQNKRQVDLETFRGFLSRQAQQLQERTGCAGVRFRLIEEDGQLRLKAKPVHRGA